ncbi:MAG: hypothetical protein ACJ8F7_02005 [Gemmataceae bacterium]
MDQMGAPPDLPVTALEERPGGDLNFRLKQVMWTAVTVFLTAWFCTMGPIPAILALVVAKHVLVAILLMGLDVNRAPRRL